MFIRKMNYIALLVKALVDWVDIEIETQESTNFQTVQRAFASALNMPEGINFHVKTINPNNGGGSCHFSIRIHDVKRYLDIEQKLIKVCAKLPLKPGFKLNKIELAIDAYCDGPADHAARFYKFMANPVSDNRRMYRDFKGSTKAVPSQFESMTRNLSEGWQIAIGNKTDNEYQHIYVKDSDTINGQRQEVTKRARLEIRLSGAALPCQTPEEWRQCKFEKLADYFRQRELKQDLEPLIQTLADAADQIGERKTRNRREGGTRQYSKATKADPINRAIRQALRDLSKRWKGTGKRGRPAKTACGNSVRINELNPHKHGKELPNSNNYVYEQVEQRNQEHQPKEKTGRRCDTSSESAKPIQTGPTYSALDDLIQQYEATPEAKNEHNRIDELMGRLSALPTPLPLNIEVLEKAPDAVGSPFIVRDDFS